MLSKLISEYETHILDLLKCFESKDALKEKMSIIYKLTDIRVIVEKMHLEIKTTENKKITEEGFENILALNTLYDFCMKTIRKVSYATKNNHFDRIFKSIPITLLFFDQFLTDNMKTVREKLFNQLYFEEKNEQQRNN